MYEKLFLVKLCVVDTEYVVWDYNGQFDDKYIPTVKITDFQPNYTEFVGVFDYNNVKSFLTNQNLKKQLDHIEETAYETIDIYFNINGFYYDVECKEIKVEFLNDKKFALYNDEYIEVNKNFNLDNEINNSKEYMIR